MFKIAKQIQAGGGELQDRADIFERGACLVLVVADGAGGISGGAEAAQFAVESVKEAPSASFSSVEALTELLISIDRKTAAAGNCGETTCVVVVVTDKSIMGASIGDSGALIVAQPAVTDLTRRQMRRPFMGSGCAIPVAFTHGPLAGTLVVASDGLLKYTGQEKIAATAAGTEFDRLAGELVNLVRYPSGKLPDDIAVLAVRAA